MLIDTHCHLDFPEFDNDRDEVIKRAGLAGVHYIINVGADVEGSRRSVELARQYPGVFAAVGIHPHYADNVTPQDISVIKELANANKVVAIGEIGLDFYKNYSRPENQKRIFIWLLELARDLNLPVILHSRDAHKDTLEIIRKFLPLKAVVHCFSADEKFLSQCLDLGLFISFTCNITYKKAQNLRDIIKLVPMNRLMLETDCPYLPAQPFRGKRNEPVQVRILAEESARLKGMSFEALAQETTANARSFFRL